MITGEGTLRGHRVAIVVSEFSFLAGSIGVIAAERIVEAVERATAERLPLIAAPASAGTCSSPPRSGAFAAPRDRHGVARDDVPSITVALPTSSPPKETRRYTEPFGHHGDSMDGLGSAPAGSMPALIDSPPPACSSRDFSDGDRVSYVVRAGHPVEL